MLSCKEVSRLVSDSLDRKLTWRQRLAMRFHLLMCRFCSRFHKQIQFLRGAAQNEPTAVEGADPTGPVLSPEARERIKRLIENDPS